MTLTSPQQHKLKRVLIPLATLAAVLVAWQIAVQLGLVPNFMLPTPLQVLAALAADKNLLFQHSLTTLAEAGLGLAAGVALGFVLALLMDSFEPIYLALSPLMTVSQTIPTVAIAPLLVLWLGYGLLPKVVLVVLATFFPVAVSLVSGFRSCDPDLIAMLKTLGATRWQIFWHAKVPAASAQFFSGLKISATYAIVGAVIAEWLGGFWGLGVYMTRVRKSFAYDRMFAVILIISALSLALMATVSLVQRLVCPWQYRKPNKTNLPVRIRTMKHLATDKNMSRRAFLATAGSALAGTGALTLAACAASGTSSATSASDQANSGSSRQNAGQNVQKLTFCLDYTPNTNHTGLYVAQAKGYFADEGLEVEIVQPAEDGAEAMIGSGQAQLGVSYQDYLANALALDQPLPITAVAAVLQHNTSGIMSRKADGITHAKLMENHVYATWDMPVEQATIKQIMTADGGNFDALKMVPYATDDEVAGLKANMFDCVWVYEGWAVQNAFVQNYEVNYFSFASMDPVFDFYTPVLAANNDFLSSNPDTVRAFLRAAEKGYAFAISNPTDAAQCLLDAAPELDEKLVKASAAYLSSAYQADAKAWGVFDGERWARYFSWLNDNKLVARELDPKAGFTNEYLPSTK